MNAKTSWTLRTSRELFDSCLVLPLTVLLVSVFVTRKVRKVRKVREVFRRGVMDIETIGKDVLDCAYAIHTRFGSGLLEKAYRVILATELRRLGHKVEEEKVCGFSYNGQDYQNMFRLDLLVDDEVVVELKSVTRKEPVFFKQCLTYLHLLDKRLGFVINFGMPSLKDGIDRVVNKL